MEKDTQKTLLLKQPENGYRYGSDTIVLYDFFSSFKPSGYVLDVGSGCGILALLTKRDFEKTNVFAVELQKEMFQFGLYNRQANLIDVTFVKTAFQKFSPSCLFDFIVSNPPFFSKTTKQSQNKAISIAKYDEELPLGELAQKVSKILKPNGSFVFCYAANRLNFVINTLKENFLCANVMQFVHTKTDKDASLVLIKAKKNKVKSIKILPSFVYTVSGKSSKQLQEAIKKANVKTIE